MQPLRDVAVMLLRRSTAGNLVRTFTTLVLTGDPLILASSLTQGVFNSILLYQGICTARAAKSGLFKEKPPAEPPAGDSNEEDEEEQGGTDVGVPGLLIQPS